MPEVIQTTESFTEAVTESETEALKWEFLNIVFLSNAINAALGHNKTYVPTATDEDTETLRRQLSSAMAEFAEKYKSPVAPADHRANLTALEEQVTKKCGAFLVGGKVRKEGHFRRGTAQKAFNLYLKFLWCMGRIPIPPDCTIDSNVIGKLPKEFRGVKWTQIDSDSEYGAIIEEVRKIAGHEPLPEWELREMMDVMRGLK
jgi:hypothetical protein